MTQEALSDSEVASLRQSFDDASTRFIQRVRELHEQDREGPTIRDWHAPAAGAPPMPDDYQLPDSVLSVPYNEIMGHSEYGNFPSPVRDAISYIGHIATANPLVNDTAIGALLNDDDDNISLDRHYINQRIFGGQTPTVVKRNFDSCDEVFEENAEHIKEQFKIGVSVIDQLKSELRTAKSRLDATIRNYNEDTSHYVTISEKLRSAEDSGGKELLFADSIKQVIKKDLVKFVGYDKSYAVFYFITPEITSNYINPAAGMNISVPMGKYLLALNSGFSLEVYPYENNKIVEGYYHPNVDTNGYVCWGNKAETVPELLRNGNIEGVIRILLEMFTEYNPDNPYIHLERFKGVTPAEMGFQVFAYSPFVSDKIRDELIKDSPWLGDFDVVNTPWEEIEEDCKPGDILENEYGQRSIYLGDSLNGQHRGAFAGGFFHSGAVRDGMWHLVNNPYQPGIDMNINRIFGRDYDAFDGWKVFARYNGETKQAGLYI